MAATLGLGALIGVPPAYWLDLRGYRPTEAAKKIARPMLILQGGRDYQVLPAELGVWRKSLSARRDVEFRLYPSLNHIFIAGTGKSTPAEYDHPGHVEQQVIDDIAVWVEKSRGH